MVAISVHKPDDSAECIHNLHFPCQIGRHRNSGIVLASWRVARCHAVIRQDGNFLTLVDQGSLGGTWVNETRIVEYSPLSDDDEISIAGFRLRLAGTGSGRSGTIPSDNGLAGQPGVSTTRAELPELSRFDSSDKATVQNIEQRRRLHAQLLDSMDLRRQEIRHLDNAHLRATAKTHLERIVSQHGQASAVTVDTDFAADAALITQVLDEAVGLGILEQLLDREDISEIMVNGCQSVFVERHGRLENTGLRFSSDQAILSVIERIVSPIGRRIDDASPMVDARLPDGSRVNAVIPPLALEGPCLTIRRFNSRQFDSQDLVRLGSLSGGMLQFLLWCVANRLNTVVSGGTGSGKTTLLNLLGSHIEHSERIVTIEDAAELQLSHPNKVTLEARPENSDGGGLVTIRDLVRNALRMRPDRIVIGECRGGEAIDMLQAMNTGHDGSLTTVHANSARDALSRLEVMVLMSGIDIPVVAIREQIASAVHIVIQQQRERNGCRRIVEIAEVTGMEGVQIQTQPLFSYNSHEDRFLVAGNVPFVFDRIHLSPEDPVRQIFGSDHHGLG